MELGAEQVVVFAAAAEAACLAVGGAVSVDCREVILRICVGSQKECVSRYSSWEHD